MLTGYFYVETRHNNKALQHNTLQYKAQRHIFDSPHYFIRLNRNTQLVILFFGNIALLKALDLNSSHQEGAA